MTKVDLTSQGIKKNLDKFTPLQAVSEYIWNGFDAGASLIELNTNIGEVVENQWISIKDNGKGIPRNELSYKFKPYNDSEKHKTKKEKKWVSIPHGKDGVGRFTFFKFAMNAMWTTVYLQEQKRLKYSISIDERNLNQYNPSDLEETEDEIGTMVKIVNIFEGFSIQELTNFLIKEFGWFLELNIENKYAVKINDIPLNYLSIIKKKDEFSIIHESETSFSIRFILWSCAINNEYSRYYFLDHKNTEKFKKTTTLNNKGDNFFHSVYIKSNLFENLVFLTDDLPEQNHLISVKTTKSKEYTFLMKTIDDYLRKERKLFLGPSSDQIIKDYSEKNIFPKFGTSIIDMHREKELKTCVAELYKVEPKFFSNLNIEQKKTFVRLLNLILETGEEDKLFKIIEEVVQLDAKERSDLADILKFSKLSSITKTIRLIQDRFLAVSQLTELVFNKTINANEVKHLQQFIENHYWIFGEQYNLVTAAEKKFEEALRRYTALITGERINAKINHPDKNKEMDIFIVRQDFKNNMINSIVVELKHPSINLGKKQVDQIIGYLNVINKQGQFNAPNMCWEYLLVGNGFDSSGYIEGMIENARNHGENSLIFKANNHKVYVKKWSEIFADFELRHKFLQQRLEINRDGLINTRSLSADEIVQISSTENTAKQTNEKSN